MHLKTTQTQAGAGRVGVQGVRDEEALAGIGEETASPEPTEA